MRPPLGYPGALHGEDHPKAKMDEAAVKRIRSLYEQGFGAYRIAREFGVSHTTIYQIIKRETWKHVE